jgi:hypothetical protein
MTSIPTKDSAFVETPETDFWQECRKRAQELGIPAWKLAEEGFTHWGVDKETPVR